MTSPLFREEVGRNRTSRLHGQILVSAPLSNALLSWIAVAFISAAVVFAVNASFSRKETVSGWLSPQGGLVRVQAREGGTVEGVHVAEGAMVRDGGSLITLRLSSDTPEGDPDQSVDRALDLEETSTRSRNDAAAARIAVERNEEVRRIGTIRAELLEHQRRIALGTERLTIAEDDLKRSDLIARKGFMPNAQLDARRFAVIGAETGLSQMRVAALQMERELSAAQSRLKTLAADLLVLNAEADLASSGLSQKRTENALRGRHVATAPIRGRVSALLVERGQTVAPGAAVAVLVPVDARLEAELYVPSRAAGFIRAGQEVRLMYQAFPHQKFGVGRGQVTEVSSTVLAPTEIAIPGLQVEEPVFRVRARLNQDSVVAYGESIGLRPGMLLTADVVIDRRTLLEWLLDPLYAAGRRG